MFSRRYSIAGQLTLFYSAASFTMISIIAIFLFWAMTNVLYKADHQFLLDEINILKNIIKNKPNDIQALKQEVNDIPNALQSSAYHYYIRILDKNKNILAETPNMTAVLQANDFFDAKKNSTLFEEYQWWKSVAGYDYLLTNYLFKSNKENSSWKIQIALDVSYQQKVITKFRNLVLMVIIAGAFISILLGYLLSRKGMRQLYNLTQTTRKITANALQQRINPELWPRELNELGTAYNQMLDRIESSISKLTQFSDDLAHELRTPINNLMGEAEIALSKSSTLDEYQYTIGSMLEELNRIYQIIENLLFLARAENPQINLQKTLLNAKHEIELMCKVYQAIADEKNIKLTCVGEATLHANAIMFKRMIGNLLSNAIKYSNNESEVHIKIQDVENHTTQIIISDNGSGIASEHLNSLFQRFYRVDEARAQSGTGLGLSIVKSIIDLHQGTISISSHLNAGTSVIIHLPK